MGLFGDVRDATDVCFAFGVDTTAEGILKAPNVCAVGEILPAKVCVAVVADKTLAATEVGAAGEILAAKVAAGVAAAADEIPGLAEVCVADAAGPFDCNCGAFDELVAS